MSRIHALTVAFGALVFLLCPAASAQTTQPTTDKAADPNLKKVLIIGDSISIGYTPFVTAALQGVAEVHHNPGNAATTGKGLENIDAWIGDTKWDVIHFNWGLHDLCHWDGKKKDRVNGKLSTTPEQYEANLEKLVTRLKQTQAKLIWAHTTHVPEGEPGRFPNAEQTYNRVAQRVMEKHGIVINDLETLSREMPDEHRARAGDVHYKQQGYEILGAAVEKAIRAQLNAPTTEKPD